MDDMNDTVVTRLIRGVRTLMGRQHDDELHDVVLLVGPPRSALDIADELEREQAAARAEQEANG
jgi:hypothetical protein